MKTKLFTLFMVCFAFAVQAQIKTPQPSPTAKSEDIIGLTDVTLEYSRPSLRGRTAYGGLVPFGEKWFAYSTRRLKENPRMANDIMKAIFVRG